MLWLALGLKNLSQMLFSALFCLKTAFQFAHLTIEKQLLSMANWKDIVQQTMVLFSDTFCVVFVEGSFLRSLCNSILSNEDTQA